MIANRRRRRTTSRKTSDSPAGKIGPLDRQSSDVAARSRQTCDQAATDRVQRQHKENRNDRRRLLRRWNGDTSHYNDIDAKPNGTRPRSQRSARWRPFDERQSTALDRAQSVQARQKSSCRSPRRRRRAASAADFEAESWTDRRLTSNNLLLDRTLRWSKYARAWHEVRFQTDAVGVLEQHRIVSWCPCSSAGLGSSWPESVQADHASDPHLRENGSATEMVQAKPGLHQAVAVMLRTGRLERRSLSGCLCNRTTVSIADRRHA